MECLGARLHSIPSEKEYRHVTYHLGTRSLKRLMRAHPDLQRVVNHAIRITPVDFTVLEVARTVRRQRVLVDKGSSTTMNSRHIPKLPRYTSSYGKVSHAVDLGAWVDRRVDWSWPLYYEIAMAMKQAAEAQQVALLWGGVWDENMSKLEGSLENEVADYVNRMRTRGVERVLSDGPHFQLPWDQYPVK